MKRAAIVGTATLALLLGTTAPVSAQQGKQKEQPGNSDKQDKDKGHAEAAKQQHEGQAQKGAPQAEQQQQVQEKKEANRQRQAEQQQQVQEKKEANWQRQAEHRQQVRLSQERQHQLIAVQQRRVVEYRRRLGQEQPLAREYAERLQRQKRTAHYRFYQDYLTRMREQQLALQRSYDYDSDPYFYTASSYRYRRGGTYYDTNQYGADVLRQAIGNGYAEGYGAGQADRQDRWASDYQDSYAYQVANYGYSGYYGEQADYNYYFREGFNRGYQDGYNSRTQYGQYSNGSGSILGEVLSQILNLQSLR